MEVTDDVDMICAALLHDVVEDTAITAHEISEIFGKQVGLYVSELTEISQPEDGNRAKRKAIDRERIANAHPHSKTIKLADMICNLRDIVEHDPKFAQVYIEEKEALLTVLTDGEPELYALARKTLEESREKLELLT